jgi:transcriptional regulator with XRE-family HTH domain
MAVKKKDSARLAKRLGGNLSERRKQLGWTQEMVAERVGVDAETISRIERGAHLPSLPTLDRLAVALRNVPPATCYRMKDPKRPAKRRPLAHGFPNWGLTIGHSL